MNKELITIPRRGIRVIPPDETATNMQRAKSGEIVRWSNEEKIRLQALINCSILAKRYPTPQDGERFMQTVNYEWQEELRSMANELSDSIVNEWNTISPDKDIAVILFGSVAKGLVKDPNSQDPSNIDMAVIGDISPEERSELFDKIRPKRNQLKTRIISKCPNVDMSDPTNPGNAGVVIQHSEKLRKSGYETARRYIASRAEPLYDPAGIWRQIESEALNFVKKPRKSK